MESVFLYIVQFFFYSAAGWVMESLYCSIGEHRLINRGFLTGPLCPIYGTATLVMTIILYNPFRDRPWIVFLLGMFVCDIVEYSTSFLMERLFHARWWDYTYEFLNLHGRICLKHTIYWGIASIGFVEVIHPGVDKLLHQLQPQTLLYLTIALLAVFALDLFNAVRKALDIRQLEDKLRALMDSLSGSLNSIKSSLGGTYESVQQSFEEGNEKFNDKRNEVFEQIQDVITQFELRFSARSNQKENKNKLSNRFLRNNFSIEKTTKKQLERLRKLGEEIKANIFENGEMQ